MQTWFYVSLAPAVGAEVALAVAVSQGGSTLFLLAAVAADQYANFLQFFAFLSKGQPFEIQFAIPFGVAAVLALVAMQVYQCGERANARAKALIDATEHTLVRFVEQQQQPQQQQPQQPQTLLVNGGGSSSSLRCRYRYSSRVCRLGCYCPCCQTTRVEEWVE